MTPKIMVIISENRFLLNMNANISNSLLTLAHNSSKLQARIKNDKRVLLPLSPTLILENLMDLKKILKLIKLNESTISMILGSLVIIVVGVLVVNYIKGKNPSSVGILPPEASKTENPNMPVTKAESHKVTKGENLWKIAQNYYGSGYNWVDIASANKLKNPGTISEGQELTIPAVEVRVPQKVEETKKATPTNKVQASTSQQEAISGATYTVIKGDNLWKIAVRAYSDGYQWVKIARENKLSHPGIIHPGNILALPR
jgi:LysM repeat protein